MYIIADNENDGHDNNDDNDDERKRVRTETAGFEMSVGVNVVSIIISHDSNKRSNSLPNLASHIEQLSHIAGAYKGTVFLFSSLVLSAPYGGSMLSDPKTGLIVVSSS